MKLLHRTANTATDSEKAKSSADASYVAAVEKLRSTTEAVKPSRHLLRVLQDFTEENHIAEQINILMRGSK